MVLGHNQGPDGQLAQSAPEQDDANGPLPCVGVTCWPDRHQGECRWGPAQNAPTPESAS